MGDATPHKPHAVTWCDFQMSRLGQQAAGPLSIPFKANRANPRRIVTEARKRAALGADGIKLV